MIAVDTNLLVYAHRPEAPFHDRDYSRFPELTVRNPLLAAR